MISHAEILESIVRFAPCFYCYVVNGRISFQLRFFLGVSVEFLFPLFM